MKPRAERVAIGLVVVSMFTAACSGDDEPAAPTTTIAAATSFAGSATIATDAGPSTTAAPRISDPVVAYYEALNTEDVPGMEAAWPTGDPDIFAAVTAGVKAKVSATCSPQGGREDAIECVEEVGRHDFYTPAGVTGQVTVVFTIQDGVIVDREVVETPEAYQRYREAFRAWLETAHPDVYQASYRTDGELPFATAADALAVVALVDEFLAQSDEYPLEP